MNAEKKEELQAMEDWYPPMTMSGDDFRDFRKNILKGMFESKKEGSE